MTSKDALMTKPLCMFKFKEVPLFLVTANALCGCLWRILSMIKETVNFKAVAVDHCNENVSLLSFYVPLFLCFNRNKCVGFFVGEDKFCT